MRLLQSAKNLLLKNICLNLLFFSGFFRKLLKLFQKQGTGICFLCGFFRFTGNFLCNRLKNLDRSIAKTDSIL